MRIGQTKYGLTDYKDKIEFNFYGHMRWSIKNKQSIKPGVEFVTFEAIIYMSNPKSISIEKF